MITWMQKHKKYLVITIWISTIAFVGAGFVGWGAYDFNNNRATSVAKVGHRTISIQEFQQTYSDLYNYYASKAESQFTKEQAEEMGLDTMALQKLIQDNLFLNYADDLGIKVSNKDIIHKLIQDKSFEVNGKFDRNKYENVLKSARITVKDYENSLKNKILLEKLFTALNLKPNKEDLEMLASSLFMQDKLSIEILNISKDQIKIDEKELKALWEKNKTKYLTKTTFVLKTKFIPQVNLDVNKSVLMGFYQENKGDYRDGSDKLLSFEDAAIDVKKDYDLKNTKKIALEDYLKIKKGELNATANMTISEDNDEFPINELDKAQVGDILKPFEYKNGYLITQVDKINRPVPMNYDQARSEVLKLYEEEKTKKILEDKSKQALENFKGTDIGFVSRDSKKNIDGLTKTEFLTFLMKLFESSNKSGYVVLNEKAVVYQILEQKLLNTNKIQEYKDLLTQNAYAIKNGQLEQSLLEALQKRYDIEQYYKR